MELNVMKKNFFYLLLVFVTVLVSACSGKSGNQTGGGKSILMPPASGRPYELLVVINQDMWERPAGREDIRFSAKIKIFYRCSFTPKK